MYLDGSPLPSVGNLSFRSRSITFVTIWSMSDSSSFIGSPFFYGIDWPHKTAPDRLWKSRDFTIHPTACSTSCALFRETAQKLKLHIVDRAG
jgi:hypothetical protein